MTPVDEATKAVLEIERGASAFVLEGHARRVARLVKEVRREEEGDFMKFLGASGPTLEGLYARWRARRGGSTT